MSVSNDAKHLAVTSQESPTVTVYAITPNNRQFSLS
jgi:6-phosphogluconolactonase (cycloisomerase 2 family)